MFFRVHSYNNFKINRRVCSEIHAFGSAIDSIRNRVSIVSAHTVSIRERARANTGTHRGAGAGGDAPKPKASIAPPPRARAARTNESNMAAFGFV